MRKLTNKEKVKLRRAAFSTVMVVVISVMAVITFAGAMDMIFESYESVRKAIGTVTTFAGMGVIGILFYIWDELIFTNVRKEKREVE